MPLVCCSAANLYFCFLTRYLKMMRSCWKTFAHSGCGNPCICPVCRQDVGKTPKKRSISSSAGQQEGTAPPGGDVSGASPSSATATDATPLASSAGESAAYDSVTISNGGSRVMLMQVEQNPWEGMYSFRFPGQNRVGVHQANSSTISETSSLLHREDTHGS